MSLSNDQHSSASLSAPSTSGASRPPAQDVLAAVEIPLTRVRRAVAKTMTASAAVPQFSVDREIQMQGLLALRETLPKTISAVDLIHAAIAGALVEHPRLNAAWQDNHIVEFEHVNLGVAVAVADGLLVPAINCAEQLNLVELSEARRSLTEAARNGTLQPKDLGTATVSVSNLGPTGITGVRPMVIPPQATIIGLPGRRRDGTTCITVSCDHRVVDGYPASQFLASLAELIEEPSWLSKVAG